MRSRVLLPLLWLPGLLNAADGPLYVEKGPLFPSQETTSHLKYKDGEYLNDLWEIPITNDIGAFEINLTQTTADLDLYLLKNPWDPLEEAIRRSASDRYKESVSLSRWEGETPLTTGSYYLQVVGYTSKKIKTPASVDYKIVLKTHNFGPGTVLDWNREVPGFLSHSTGMFQIFKFQVSADSPAWRLDLLNTQMDLNLFIKEKRPPLGPEDADFISDSLKAQESFVYSGKKQKEETLWFVLVTGLTNPQHPEKFKIRLAPETNLPEVRKPQFKWVKTPTDQRLSSVVEISNSAGRGSGCLMSAQGHILTNYHVVEGMNGEPDPWVTVGLTQDPNQPAEEFFQARVLAVLKDQDLALLKIEKDLYGRPWEPQSSLPFFSQWSLQIPSIGEEIFCAGYPGQGGSGSRTSLTLSRGILSGMEETKEGILLKTDAEINYGNSGGAAWDSQGRLLGLPTSIIGEDSGQLGFIHPLTLVPQSWWEKIQGARP